MKPIRGWWSGLKRQDDSAFMPEDLLPEFVQRPELVDGGVYVLAEQEAGGVLRIGMYNPTYLASHDAWCSPCGGVQPRCEQDLWIPLSQWNEALERARRRQFLRTHFQLTA